MGSKRRFHTLQILCLILAFWPHFSLSLAQQCDMTATVKDNVIVPLEYSGFREISDLIWKHGDETVFERNISTVITGNKEDVTSAGSLVLRSVQMEQSGEYSAQVTEGTTGRQVYKTVKTLCVTDPQPCNMTVVVGDNVTIPLPYPHLKGGDELVWKHGHKIVFEKKTRVITGRKEDVTSSGSLMLHRVPINQSGPYYAEVHDGDTGESLYETMTNLCVRGELVYRFIREDVQLDPKTTEIISSITWKKENNKLAEWDKNLGLYYYKRCKTEDQCDLKTTTGVLIMKGLKPEDKAKYYVEINGKTFQHDFQLIVLDGKTKYMVESVGQHVKLDPKVTETINSITWKKEGNTIAKWASNSELNYYGRCRTGDQCELNSTTGVLIMKGLKPEDKGRYSAEINDKTSEEDFLLTVDGPGSKASSPGPPVGYIAAGVLLPLFLMVVEL